MQRSNTISISPMYSKYVISLAVILLLLPVSAPADEQKTEVLFPLKEVWRHRVEELEVTAGQRAIYCSPATDSLRLFYASANGTCGALLKQSGVVSWTFHIGEPFNNGLVLFDEGPVVVATEFRIFALDRENGFVIWHRHVAPGLSVPISGSGNSLLACDKEGGIICLAPSTGAIRWQTKIGASVTAPPYINDGRVFLGDEAGNIYCLDDTDGKEIWKYVAGGGIRSGFAVHEEWLFFGSDDNYLYSLDAGEGSLRWRTRTAGDVNGFPVCSERTVFITPSDRTLRAYRCSNGHARDGSPMQLNTNIGAPLLLDGSQVLIPRKHELVAVGEAELRERGKFTAPADITTGIYRDPETGFIYFGCRSGDVMAIAPEAIADANVPLRDTGPEDRRVETRTVELIPPESTPQEQQENPLPEEPPTEQPTPTEPETSEETPEQPLETEEETTAQLETADDSDLKAAETAPDDESEPEEITLSPEQALEEAKEATVQRQLEQAAKLWKTALAEDAESTYTVAVGLFCRRPAVLSLLSKLSGQEVMVFDRLRDEQTCYFVCVGRFGSREEAERFLEGLDDEVKRQNPAAHRLDSFIP